MRIVRHEPWEPPTRRKRGVESSVPWGEGLAQVGRQHKWGERPPKWRNGKGKGGEVYHIALEKALRTVLKNFTGLGGNENKAERNDAEGNASDGIQSHHNVYHRVRLFTRKK